MIYTVVLWVTFCGETAPDRNKEMWKLKGGAKNNKIVEKITHLAWAAKAALHHSNPPGIGLAVYCKNKKNE